MNRYFSIKVANIKEIEYKCIEEYNILVDYVEKLICNKGEKYSFESYLVIKDKESLITSYSEKLHDTMIENLSFIIDDWDFSDSNDIDWYVINSVGKLYMDFYIGQNKDLFIEAKGVLNYLLM